MTTDPTIPVSTGSSGNYVNMGDSDYSNQPDGVFKDERAGAVNIDQDDVDDLQSLAPSIASSVLTADGIHDPIGFAIVCLVILVGDMARGVFFPTMWPLVEALGGSSVALGYSVASFSFGRILVSPLFGGWSVTHGYSKTLLFSCSILWVGTLLYTQAQNVGHVGFLIFAQVVMGLGSGTLGVTRAFVADVTAQRSRTTYMAWITAVQYSGFTVTPFVGSFFTKVLNDKEYKIGLFRFNQFTAPAYFMNLVITATLVLMLQFFRNRVRISAPKNNNKKSAKRMTIEDAANQVTFVGLTVYDCCILGCMLLNVSTKGSISAFETLGVSIAQSHFDMSSSRAGVIVATCGSIGVVALLSMGHMARFLSDIQLICGGMGIMCFGVLSLGFLEKDVINPSWKFCTAIFLIYSVGYPIGHTAVIGLFSKIVGRRPQGALLGWFASAGSLARLCFPIMSGYLTNFFGVSSVFYVLLCVLPLSIAFTMYGRQTLLFLSQ
uniref:Major facilitator superfamily (MFS) profile domain-containing protein n=1 Tax=Pseudo-nitzschia australis TaxID=44445 RepID=A0A7S4AKJ6_9STRA|mmetsp:Transcript_9060/g.19585  ORF Transcript_9060/g.19585 Transcript_9060/m.19585 type:complete len:492 (-) Transcript_9060:423-1898(-)|eukprot:CAMPEP_0168181298 /NCGR_PEP_ID=MMETSP0139_2-20121125/11130_1 /TAXON_ID=44445 /ORGANISM="Pseudo-nitzschia australis, Strain 10249 10 AB" /LENGTH=491 /DNA_ID=CAMNT_0008101841 /DNA_START=259 /DNA_END=1734 /DNA_ORIENTATION=-